MGQHPGYSLEPFSANRRMVSANSSVAREKNTIHLLTEVDVTGPRRLIAEHRQKTGEALSLTAYVVTCLARAVAEFPALNSFRKGGRLIILDDVTISVAIERHSEGESVPEPVGIQAVNRKTYREVNDELRASQHPSDEDAGATQPKSLTRFMPGFLLRALTRLAYREVAVWQRYGVVGVTAVGMFGSGPMWLMPLASSTVTVAVGSFAKRPSIVDGALEERENLCLTLSFDHDIVDGAPAARFAKRFGELLSSGDELNSLTRDSDRQPPAEVS